MITSRNVIFTIIVIAVLSILFAIISFMVSSRHTHLNRDFYGVRGEGYRAVYDLLEKFGVPVERSVIPLSPKNNNDTTFVIWAPQRAFVDLEPAYLKRINTWVINGGNLIVAFPKNDSMDYDRLWGNVVNETRSKVSLLEVLGVEHVRMKVLDKEENSLSKIRKKKMNLDNYEDFRNQFKREPVKFISSPVKREGKWATQLKDVNSIKIPVSNLQVLKLHSAKPESSLTVTRKDGSQHILAASFQNGKGHITVISEPFISQNRVIAQGDNSILTTQLLTSSGNRIVFDGFYHGLMVRGNPLWLYSLPGYGAVTFALLLLLGFWIWRESLFLGPPLEVKNVSRRNISEYIESMAILFSRGKTINSFYLKTIRDGVLRTMSAELELYPGADSFHNIIHVLSRRDPERCKQFSKSIAEIDSLLAMGKKCNKRMTVSAVRKVINCL